MVTKVIKNASKNFSSKHSQKLLDHAKQSATDALKTTWKRAIQKTAEATGDLIGNKIADNIIKVLRSSQRVVQKQLEAKQKCQKYIYVYISWKKTVKYWWSKINIII